MVTWKAVEEKENHKQDSQVDLQVEMERSAKEYDPEALDSGRFGGDCGL